MKSILVMILLFVGAAVAAPIDVEERIEYTTSLNSMASIVMNWYGSLITTNEQVSFSTTEIIWDDYRAQYPENITQIQITSTDLTKLDASDKYQFNVKSLITYKNPDGAHSQLVNETFIFQVTPLTRPIIKKLSRNNTEQTKTIQISEFNRSHYKAREFAYAWLAYLDGVASMQSTIYATQWLEKASYSMKIGGDEIQGSVSSTLDKRKQYLTKGGHLLRALDVTELQNKPDTLILDLIIEWKGVNQAGKPVLAKIQQKIEYTIQQDNSWEVISIKEQHLLPDIAPWIGLLC